MDRKKEGLQAARAVGEGLGGGLAQAVQRRTTATYQPADVSLCQRKILGMSDHAIASFCSREGDAHRGSGGRYAGARQAANVLSAHMDVEGRCCKSAAAGAGHGSDIRYDGRAASS